MFAERKLMFAERTQMFAERKLMFAERKQMFAERKLMFAERKEKFAEHEAGPSAWAGQVWDRFSEFPPYRRFKPGAVLSRLV